MLKSGLRKESLHQKTLHHHVYKLKWIHDVTVVPSIVRTTLEGPDPLKSGPV